jgi:hypothetical protein
MSALRINDRVQVDAETEVLVLLAIDNDEAWLRDDLGQHQVRRLEDLAPAPPLEGMAPLHVGLSANWGGV